MHDGHAGFVIVNGVLDRLAHQALGAFARHRLDADARGVGEADFLDTQLVLQELDELFGLVTARFELDAGVNVFGVLAEDHHVGLLGLFHRGRNTRKVLDGPQADVQVKLLAHRHVQTADAATHGRRQRALDGHHVVTHCVQGFFRQPDVGTIDLGGLFTRIHFHPVNLFLAAVGLGNSGIHHFYHHRRDVHAGAVAFNERNDRLIRHIQ